MKKLYRVQEYIADIGAYWKYSIIDGISYLEYRTKNLNPSSFYVILPPNDLYGSKLPESFCGSGKRNALAHEYEPWNADIKYFGTAINEIPIKITDKELYELKALIEWRHSEEPFKNWTEEELLTMLATEGIKAEIHRVAELKQLGRGHTQ